jgi:hypothetical protein
MDTDKDDRSIVGKTVDAVKEFAATVSEAAHKAVNPEPVKSEDEIKVVPAAPTGTGFMDDAVPPTPVVIRRRKRLAKKSQSRATKTAKKVKWSKKAKKSAAKLKSPSVRKKATKKAKTSSSKKRTKKSKG